MKNLLFFILFLFTAYVNTWQETANSAPAMEFNLLYTCLNVLQSSSCILLCQPGKIYRLDKSGCLAGEPGWVNTIGPLTGFSQPLLIGAEFYYNNQFFMAV